MPIIRTLLSSGNTVILGTTSLTEKIFKEEFPELKHLQLPEYDISYSSILPLWLKLGTQYTKVLKAIKSEHEIVEEYIAVHNINVVISDNRYGLFGLNCKYIGPLSRLEKREAEIRYDYLFLLSGPEPTQTDLLKSVIDKLKSYKGKAVIISSSSFKIDLPANIILIKLPNANELSQLIAESKTIVCRSGYSTLMDIYLLEKKELILIPTPGQTEQEYLAEYWSKKFKSVHLAESQLGNHSF
ncbi:MAG: hypothetical protein IPJ60_08605 [Sphingobacteriaceae bacterium]|nr:hypothetical protein [Sphingobacteriaceae bacterium]